MQLRKAMIHKIKYDTYFGSYKNLYEYLEAYFLNMLKHKLQIIKCNLKNINNYLKQPMQ